LTVIFAGCHPSPEDSRSPSPPPSPAAAPSTEAEAPAWPLIDLTPESLAAEADRMRRLLGPDFVVVTVSPFVVCGDIPAPRMRRICRNTVHDCLRALQADFFTAVKPSHVIRIFLFRDAKSFRAGADRLFDYEPGTPYGYYQLSTRSLVMNIGTGGGTLVHEMVHALRNYDFPAAPTWLDEGVASLFEACTIRDDRIVGLVNWRLPVLEEGFHNGEYVPLAEILSMPERTFRNADASMHYAESRYFCLYLQHKGLLRKIYRTFRDRFSEDPFGQKFVEEATGQKLADLEKEWLDWTGTLKWK